MFILNKIEDWKTFSRAQIIRKALVWLICLFLIGGAIRAAVFAIYMANGINPNELTTFGGDVSGSGRTLRELVKLLVMVILIAPLAEELMFRLGLSFKRKTAALWAALLPLLTAAYQLKCWQWYVLVGLAAIGVAIYWLITSRTADEQWTAWKERYLLIAVWVTAIAFGLIHLRAFSVITTQLLPFVLATILLPFLGGCVMTYARVNLGFWWGVFFHILWNTPAILTILLRP